MEKKGKKKKRDGFKYSHWLVCLFYLALVHWRTGVDFLFKITVSPFNSKVNAQWIFKILVRSVAI